MRPFILILIGVMSVSWAIPRDDGAASTSFEVQRQRFPNPVNGRLEIDAEGIAFRPHQEGRPPIRWAFHEIRELRIESPQRLRILTFEDVPWMLNRDRHYTFDIREGAIGLDLVAYLAAKLPTPLVTALFPEPEEEVLVRLPAKHGHALKGGCHGELVISWGALFFRSERSDHSRWWPLEQIESVGSLSEFDFRLRTREETFHFQLKRPLDRIILEGLRRRILEPRSWLDDLRQP